MTPWTLRGALAALAVTAGALAPTGRADAAYSYTEVARAGAATTALWDINNNGLMVGYSAATASGPTQAFIYDGSTFTALTGPAGAFSTAAIGISDGDKVVGSFTSTDGGASTGFIYNPDGTYTSFAIGGATDTFLRGISADGRYVSGYYGTASVAGVGFVYDLVNGTIASVSTPDSQFTIAQGVNNAGIVVGSDILSTGGRPGFSYDVNTGTRTDLEVAGATRTALRSIDEAGIVAGWFRDASLVTHGFVGSVSSFDQIDFAGADATFIEGSNNAGVLVGNYTLGEGGGTFIARRSVPEPATLALLAAGLFALTWTRYRPRPAARRVG